MKHINNGKCPKCLEIINRYPNFNQDLLNWFKMFQAKHPEAHTSCAGRGHDEQEEKFKKRLSLAHYMDSAHNYNCALDLFVQLYGMDIYDKGWFTRVVSPEIPDFIDWYGKPGSKFRELPHIEVKSWRQLLALGKLSLVELV